MSKQQVRVLFDGTAAQSMPGIKYHGGGEYAKFMLREMIARGVEMDVALNPRLFLDKDTRALIDANLRGRVVEVSDKASLFSAVDAGGYDTFYAPLPYDYGDYSGRARLVAVIHGLRRIENPWDRYRHHYFTNPLKRLVGSVVSRSPRLQERIRRREMARIERLLRVPGAQFVTVSEHSKYSLLTFFPTLAPENIKVYYSPFDVAPNPAPDPDASDYFLMVSGNRFEKNIYRAAHTFDSLFAQGRLDGKRVVITGIDNPRLLRGLQCPERFELLPYVDTPTLDALYAGAFCFVYPSLNEGFGYPPLIAMSHGVPVVASSATSIPEACGDAAIYFSPTNTDDLANRLLMVADRPDIRAHRRALGLRRVEDLQLRQRHDLDDYIAFILE